MEHNGTQSVPDGVPTRSVGTRNTTEGLDVGLASERYSLARTFTARSSIHVTGNTVIDALHYVASRPYDLSAGPLAAIPFFAIGDWPDP